MIKQTNKLVRDKIPEIIKNNGGSCITYILDKEKYKKKLIEKICEEISEFEKDENLEELADIYTVLEALVKSYGYDMSKVIEKAESKKISNGGFESKIFMIEYDDGIGTT